jgi:NAD(P)H-hydrate epimerase
VTADQMREIDRVAVEETGPNLLQMMEHAGRTLALQCLAIAGPEWRQQRMLVLAGAGGNGGGGICAARHLANRGALVTLVLADTLAAGGVPAFQHRVYTGTPGRQIDPDAVTTEQPALVIDALVGYGLSAAPRAITADLIVWANASGATIQPRWTLTLALPKTGLRPENAGQLVLADIGIPAETFRRAGVTMVNPFGDRFRIPLTAP